MNWPMDVPFFRFVYYIVNTAGIGGILVGLIATTSLVSYFLTLRGIIGAGNEAEQEEYTYPTPALTHEHE
ncbi:MAG: hypothetical protein GXP41_04690 [Chloroflexi bacterium]|nr:hypothetical protein [Chloroflexota bacterium]